MSLSLSHSLSPLQDIWPAECNSFPTHPRLPIHRAFRAEHSLESCKLTVDRSAPFCKCILCVPFVQLYSRKWIQCGSIAFRELCRAFISNFNAPTLESDHPGLFFLNSSRSSLGTTFNPHSPSNYPWGKGTEEPGELILWGAQTHSGLLTEQSQQLYPSLGVVQHEHGFISPLVAPDMSHPINCVCLLNLHL